MIEKLKPHEEGVIDENGTVWADEENYLLGEILGLCACGDPRSIAGYIKSMFEKYVSILDEQHDVWEEARYQDFPTMFFLYWADRNNFTSHGGTIRCSWITDKGKELLKDLEAVGI